MAKFLKDFSSLLQRCYVLARPYGRKKLLVVMGFSLMQALFQVLGVTSIFPFLALAADPSRLRNSRFGSKFLEFLPPMDDQHLLFVAGGFAIIMLVLSNGVNLTAEFIRNRYAYGFGHWLRSGLLRKIAFRPYSDFLQQNTAALTNKVNGDTMGYTTGVLLPLLDVFARVFTILFLLVLVFYINPALALIAALFFSIIYLCLFGGFKKLRRRASDEMKLATRGIHITAQQILAGIKPVKVHQAEEAFLGRFARHSAKQAKVLALSPMLSSTPRYFIEPLAFGALVAGVLFYSARGQDLITILPNIAMLAFAAYRLLPAFQLLYGQASSLTTSLNYLEEVYDEFLALENAIATGKTLPESATSLKALALHWKKEIRFEGLGFSYAEAKKPVLEDLNLVIPKNSSLGIVGETGSGKSTLVDLLLGLHTPTSGQILVDDTPLDSKNIRSWQKGIGYVPQDIFLLDDTVLANIAFGLPFREVDMARVREAAQAAQILEFIETGLSNGFETLVGERGVRLSGGQRQRIGLARALYLRPELLVLDEATSALDVETEAEVMRAIEALHGSMTIVIIAHRLSTLERTDRIIRLK